MSCHCTLTMSVLRCKYQNYWIHDASIFLNDYVLKYDKVREQQHNQLHDEEQL